MAVKFSPIFNSQVVDSTGPASGWKINTYVAGSSTPATTYTTSAGTVAQSNPIILNPLGFPTNGQIWLTEGTAYKLELTNASDVVQKTEDNVSGVNDSSTTADQWVTGPTPTYISATSLSLVGDQTSTFTVGRRIKTTNSGGTIYSTITVSAYTTLTTLTVVNDSGTLDSGLSTISYGILTASNSSVPWTKVSSTGWTYTGDITMSGASIIEAEGAAVASAATTEIWATDGNTRHITGTATITSLGTAPQAGMWQKVVFDGALTLTHGANLNLPGSANITTAADDYAFVYADTTTQHDVLYFKKDGTAVTSSTTVGQTIQTVSAKKTDTWSTGTAGSWVDVTGMSKAITVSGSGSNSVKILVAGTVANGVAAGSTIFGRILRDSTAIGVGDTAGSRTSAGVEIVQMNADEASGFMFTWHDESLAAAAYTYKLQLWFETATGYFGRSTTDTDAAAFGRFAGIIMLSEVKGA